MRLPAVAQQSPGIRVVGAVEAGVEPIPLTKQAVELRRVRDEHLRLIESIPPTLGATPTLTMVEKQDVAVARIMDHPDGVPVGPAVDEDWFNPDLGITFYRDSGGDWTARRVRETHSHRNLFFYSDYPGTIANFADGSIHDALAREMVFEATREDTAHPGMSRHRPWWISLQSSLGWELRDSSGAGGEPVVYLCSLRVDGGACIIYSIGGVMLMGIGSVGEGEDRCRNTSHRAGGSAR